MRKSDIKSAIALTDTEGWNYTRDDFLRMLDAEPAGHFVAVNVRGEVIGLVSTFIHGNTGWLGNCIVSPSERGKRIGVSLILHAVSRLKAGGASDVRLYSYEHMVKFYEKLGFYSHGKMQRFSGELAVPRKSLSVSSIQASQINGILELDRKASGIDRAGYLRVLINSYRENLMVYMKYGRVCGYMLVRPNPDSTYEIGPWIAENMSVARALLSTAGGRCEVIVPLDNVSAVGILLEHRFRQDATFVEMSLSGINPVEPRMVYGICGLESG